MAMFKKMKFTVLVITFLIPVLTLAHAYKIGDIAIEHPWSAATPPNAGVAAGYLSITNNSEKDDVFLGGSTTAAARVEIHEMKMDNGIMRMRPIINGLPIAAGGTVSLSPDSYHIMFFEPKKQWKEGDRIPVTLQFKHAGNLQVDFAVHAPASQADSSHHSHH